MRVKMMWQKTGVIMAIGALVLSQTNNAFAFWHHSRSRYFDEYPRYVKRLPHEHRRVFVSKVPYYYYDGLFYREGITGYVLVNAPVGALVPVLPPSCEMIVINGTTYYTYDNVYYVREPKGYLVVPQPVVNTPATQPVEVSESSFVVHVPNANGSYMPVVIRKTKDGYVGPQGEYYSEQPTVDQLKAMYGK